MFDVHVHCLLICILYYICRWLMDMYLCFPAGWFHPGPDGRWDLDSTTVAHTCLWVNMECGD